MGLPAQTKQGVNNMPGSQVVTTAAIHDDDAAA